MYACNYVPATYNFLRILTNNLHNRAKIHRLLHCKALRLSHLLGRVFAKSTVLKQEQKIVRPREEAKSLTQLHLDNQIIVIRNKKLK